LDNWKGNGKPLFGAPSPAALWMPSGQCLRSADLSQKGRPEMSIKEIIRIATATFGAVLVIGATQLLPVFGAGVSGGGVADTTSTTTTTPVDPDGNGWGHS
jgi:hypothetical protein